MIKIRDVIEVMENWAPSSLAETWDNVGLITGDPDRDTASVMVTLDVTGETIENAIRQQTSLIITHHPPLFKPLKNLTDMSLSSRVICKAVKEDISIYASHTNLDQVPDGVSMALAQKLGLISVSPLFPGTCGMVKFVTFTPPEYTDRIREAAGAGGAGIIGEYELCSFTSHGTGTYIPSSAAKPFAGKTGKLSRAEEDRLEMIVPLPFVHNVVEAARKVHPYDEMAYDLILLSNKDTRYGYGAVGNLKESMTPPQFTGYVAEALGVKTLTVSQGKKNLIKRVAVMGGSGKNYSCHAVARGADAFVTGDIGYHDFMDYGFSLLLVDASHRATELPVLEKIKERLLSSEWGKTHEVIIDRGNTYPITIEYSTIS